MKDCKHKCIDTSTHIVEDQNRNVETYNTKGQLVPAH